MMCKKSVKTSDSIVFLLKKAVHTNDIANINKKPASMVSAYSRGKLVTTPNSHSESLILVGRLLPLTEKRPARISIVLSVHQFACTVVPVNSYKHTDSIASFWGHINLPNYNIKKGMEGICLTLEGLCQKISRLTIKAHLKTSTFFLAIKAGECYYA